MNILANLFYQYGNRIIIAVAVINVIIFVYTWQLEKNIKKLFNPTGNSVRKVNPDLGWDNKKISELQKKYQRVINSYTLYTNITAIFPLLGIVGTVAALIKEFDDIEGLTGNFMVALSTTFWGILFAIIFKGIDAMVSGPMEMIIEDANYVIREYGEKEEQE
jgi:chemotaxis protein MotA